MLQKRPKNPLFRWLNLILSVLILYFLIVNFLPGFWQNPLSYKILFLAISIIFIGLIISIALSLLKTFQETEKQERETLDKGLKLDPFAEEKLRSKRQLRYLILLIIIVSLIILTYWLFFPLLENLK